MPLTYETPLGDVELPPERPPLPSLLVATCADALHWWIEARCLSVKCAGGMTHYPVRLLMQRHRCADWRLLEVVQRFRCRRCRAKPAALRLISDPQSFIPENGMRQRLPGGALPATVIDLMPLLREAAARKG